MGSKAPKPAEIVDESLPEVPDEAPAAAEEIIMPAEVEAPIEKPPEKQKQPCAKQSGLCVYLGPSIQGVILNGTVFSSGKSATLAEIDNVLQAYPLVADLIVSGDVLPESRIKVKTPGNLLYANYNKLAGKLKIKQGGNRNA